MIKSKGQGFVFGLIMSYAMAIGMEIYNMAINFGGFDAMNYHVLVEAFKEALYMGLFVLLFSYLWGNKIGERFMEKHTTKQDSPYICQLLRQAGTVSIMSPTMSMVATILFQIVMGGQSVMALIPLFIGTLLKNFPMAFFWNMFAAAPLTHWLFEKIFVRN